MGMGERLQRLIDTARRDILIIYLAARDPRVPWHAKFLAVATAAYVLSPLDFIPDFIPIIGLLDEAIIIPLVIWMIRQMIDEDVMEDLHVRAAARIEPLPKSVIGLLIVVSLWVAIAALIWFSVVAAHD
jgi:uncharacterized membrane protein YkvA (DUF1232 family)